MKKWMVVSSMLVLLIVYGEGRIGQASAAALTEKVEIAATDAVVENKKENLWKIFGAGVYVADNMEVGLQENVYEKFMAISAKIQQGSKKNKVWFMEAIENLEEGEVLPYDEKLGVTEEEYNYFLDAEQYMGLVKVKENRIKISKRMKQTVIQIADGSLVKEIKISADGKSLQTDVGKLSYSAEMIASDEQTVTGRWNGHMYQLGGDGTQQIVQISLGQLEENNKKIIYIKIYKKGHEVKEEILVVD